MSRPPAAASAVDDLPLLRPASISSSSSSVSSFFFGFVFFSFFFSFLDLKRDETKQNETKKTCFLPTGFHCLAAIRPANPQRPVESKANKHTLTRWKNTCVLSSPAHVRNAPAAVALPWIFPIFVPFASSFLPSSFLSPFLSVFLSLSLCFSPSAPCFLASLLPSHSFSRRVTRPSD